MHLRAGLAVLPDPRTFGHNDLHVQVHEGRQDHQQEQYGGCPPVRQTIEPEQVLELEPDLGQGLLLQLVEGRLVLGGRQRGLEQLLVQVELGLELVQGPVA